MTVPRRPSSILLTSALAGLAILAASGAQATTITIVNLDGAGEGFNDPTPAAPVGGNTGVTVGQQRLNVFTHAADVWAARISSSVEIKVGANFDPLTPCGPSSGILGSAGPETVFQNFAGALVANTWYTAALANALHGIDLDPGGNDIGATFNSSVGTPGCLPSNPWYYGLDGNGPSGSIDLATVVLHELGHGLGFLTLVSLSTGAKFMGEDDVFMLNLEDHSTGKLYPAMTNAERVAASKNNGNLHWVGPNVGAASGTLTAGTVGTHVRMFAPTTQQPGSSVSHWDTALTPNQLLEPFFTVTFPAPILEIPLFQDLGWSVASQPNISVTPGSKNYGTVLIGNTSDQNFSVMNTGSATLHVSSTSITNLGVGTGAGEISITNGVNAFNLGPGASQTVSVRFAPALPTGAKSATLRFASDDPDTPTKDVALSGTAQQPVHDLAVVKIIAPATVLVTPGIPVTKTVKVQIQNRSDHKEVLQPSVLGNGTTTGLIRLSVPVIDDDGEVCQPAGVALNTVFPVAKNLASKAKLTIKYKVTYNCTNAQKKNLLDLTPGDYSYIATAHHEEIDGKPDTHPADDVCPRAPLGIDLNPDGTINDKGCGAKAGGGFFGPAPNVTNVVKP